MAIAKKRVAAKVASNSKAGAKPTAEKVKEALSTKKVRDTVVFLDKNQPAFGNKKNEAKNLRKKLDSDKTAMRARNIASRNNKPLTITLKDEREMANAMRKANAAKAAKAKPMTEAQKQAKAMDALEAKRAKVAKKTGVRPNYGTN